MITSDSVEQTIIQLIGVLKRFQNAKGLESLYKEMIMQTFSKIEKNHQVQEDQRSQVRFISTKSIPRYLINKLSKMKGK
jgi:hypothetical protein